MNIKELKNDGLTIQVALDFGKEDYADNKKKQLNKLRRDADIKGFRKGMAPMSLIERMYGHSALVEAINSMISENLNNYIKDNNLTLIGEPLPNEEVEQKNDWENGEDFHFVFDMALAPKVDFTLSQEDKITLYDVTMSEKSKEEYRGNLLKQFGKLENCEEVKDEDFIVADFAQGETLIEGTYVSLKGMEDATKNLFIGKKVGDAFEIDVLAAFPNETDRAAMLKMKKEEMEGMDPMFTLTVKEVKNYVDAQLGEEFYTQMFGEGVVNSEEEFEAKMVERMNEEFKQDVDYRFMLDAREYLMNKTNIQLPEEFLKKWLFTVNEGKFTMEQIEAEFPMFLKDFRWQTIARYIKQEQKLEVTREALLEQARKFAYYQFAMYGISNVPQEHLDTYAESMLAKEQEGRRIYEKVEEDLVLGYVRSTVTLESKNIDSDELRKMNEEK